MTNQSTLCMTQGLKSKTEDLINMGFYYLERVLWKATVTSVRAGRNHNKPKLGTQRLILPSFELRYIS